MTDKTPEETFIKVYDWQTEFYHGNDLLVFALIYSLGEVTGQAYISERTNIPVPNVSKSIKRLESDGVIVVERTGSRAKPAVFCINETRIHEMRIHKTRIHKTLTCDLTSYEDASSQNVNSRINESLSRFLYNRIDNRISIESNRIDYSDSTGESEKKSKNLKGSIQSILEKLSITPEPKFIESLEGFIDHRKKLKKPMTENALKLNIQKAAKLSGGDVQAMTAIFNQSIERGWTGIFELKGGNAQNDTGKRERFFK